MTKKQRAKLGLVLLPIGLILSLFILWIVFVWPIYKVVQSRNWPQVDCIIDSYQTKEAGVSQSKYGNNVRYKVDIQYSYQFENKNYVSTQHSFDCGFLYSTRQLSTINMVKKCYVNPRNPTEAVLFRHYNFYYLLLSTIPALTLGACAYGTYRCLRTLRVKHPH
jgi:hypothetical protein